MADESTAQSRNEQILQDTIDGVEYTDPPQSRIEALLVKLNGEFVGKLPEAPETEGAYVLTCTVDNKGAATYSWESTT